MSNATALRMPAIVIDNGSGSCKAGIAGDSKPSSVVMSVVGHVREYVEEFCIGEKALFKRCGTVLHYPVERGIITHWDAMEMIWNHIFKYELKVKPSERPVLLSEPPLNPWRNREKTAELMFEHFNVPDLHLLPQATMSLFATGRITGLVIDSGEGVTHTVPIYEGSYLPHGVSRLDVAGMDITKYLASLLMKNSHAISSTKKAMVKDFKEKFCYVALNPKHEAEQKAKKIVKLPDGKTIKLGLHLFQAPEILFAPKTIGIEAPGIHAMIAESVRKCDRDICALLYRNVLLSGGSSLFPGMDERIFEELQEQVPKGVPVRISVAPERRYTAWVGGSALTNLTSFAPMWFTREEYKEFGPAGIHLKCLKKTKPRPNSSLLMKT